MIFTKHGDQASTSNPGMGSATAGRKAAPTPGAVPSPRVSPANPLLLAATRAKFAREAFYNLPASASAAVRAQLLRDMNTAEDAHREKLYAHLKATGRIR